jgi:2,4-dienoyl-CoA reductase-like NADH-dependent reductase (Old Yellow Enzyme family)
MIAEKAGYDAISVSCGGNHYEASMGSVYFAPGYIVPFAEQIKKAVNIPVIVVGRINAQLGEEVISAGKADFVAIGRGLIADPELPNKAKVYWTERAA